MARPSFHDFTIWIKPNGAKFTGSYDRPIGTAERWKPALDGTFSLYKDDLISGGSVMLQLDDGSEIKFSIYPTDDGYKITIE